MLGNSRPIPLPPMAPSIMLRLTMPLVVCSRGKGSIYNAELLEFRVTQIIYVGLLWRYLREHEGQLKKTTRKNCDM